MGEPGNSRGQRGNLSDHITALNNSQNTTNNSALPTYESARGTDLSLSTLTAMAQGGGSYTEPRYNTTSSGPPSIPTSLHRNTLPNNKNLRRTRTPPSGGCVNFLRPQRLLHPNRSLSLSACVDQLMMRSSFRSNNAHNSFSRQSSGGNGHSRSLENLVLHPAALGRSSIVTLDRNDAEDDTRTQSNRQNINKDCNDLTPSVI